MLTGLRGVGKTVLLNALRGAAVRKGWGTGKLEARPGQGLRRPLSSALHQAVRELGHRDEESVDHVLGVIKSFAHRDAGVGAKLKDQWSPGIDAPAVRGRADSGDIEIDLVELFTDLGGLAADVGKGIGIFIDEMQDLGPDDVSALCAACHELSQSGLPVIVVGAGLPHLPAVLSASKSYSERLFRYQRIDRLARDAADRALEAPAGRRGRGLRARGARRDVRRHRRLPLLHPGLRQGRVGPRAALADHRGRRRGRRPRGRVRARGRLLRLPLRARHAGGARLPDGDGRRRRRAAGVGRRRGRRRAQRRRRRQPRQEAAVALTRRATRC